MPALDLQHVVKAFGSVAAVDDVTFTVEPGEIVALLGPSGCGKTTTLRLIAGFETPDAGRIYIGGQDVARRRPYERNIGLVFQDYALFPHMSVAENIAFGMKHRGVARGEIPDRIAAALALVKLSGLERRRPSQLSGGQQQRVALARALVTDPDVMLLDEPLSNLDAKLRQQLRVELREILSGTGSTTIIVTHDQEEAMALADRIVLMNAGRIEQIGAPDDLYARPESYFAADFIGGANWLGGTLQAPVNGLARVDTSLGIVGALEPPAATPAGSPVAVCIRPERLAVLRDGDDPSGYDTVLAAEIDLVEHLGADRRIWLRLESGARFHADVKNLGDAPPARKARVRVGFRAADVIALPTPGGIPS
jgi:putative spermidine/putrescine transport system ATP-binding protein/putrescine transport system ATP-binding protein